MVQKEGLKSIKRVASAQEEFSSCMGGNVHFRCFMN